MSLQRSVMRVFVNYCKRETGLSIRIACSFNKNLDNTGKNMSRAGNNKR